MKRSRRENLSCVSCRAVRVFRGVFVRIVPLPVCRATAYARTGRSSYATLLRLEPARLGN